MQNPHEPDDKFVERLEWQLAREVRLRNRSLQARGRSPRSRLKTVLGVVCLMLLSMGIGAAGMAAAYQAQDQERRTLLVSGIERRIELARQAAASVAEELQSTQRGVSLGTTTQEDLLESRVKAAEAQTQLRSLELQLEEVRVTGREPLSEVSSPLVSGHDFVSERWRIEMSVPEAARELERFRLRDTEKRLALGTADTMEVDASRARVIAVEAAIEAFRKKIELRQMFLSRKVDAAGAELRVLEAEAEQRQKTLAPKVALARNQSELAKVRVQLGTGQRVEMSKAALELVVLEAEMAKAELELELVRRQIAQRPAQR